MPADIPLQVSRNRYLPALAGARAWLDALQVDPMKLRELGIKGKKKLTEQLDAYYRLWLVAGPSDKAALRARIAQVVAVTYDAAYHDLASIDDKAFKEDATSYLRTALLMEALGFNTRLYRAEIAKVQPRLNSHMAQRGPHQRLAFHWYYGHFGLAEPFPLAAAVQEGLIARRADAATMSTADAYQLTHEVFVPYEYGDRLDLDPFDAAAKEYLRRSLNALVPRYIEKCDPDLLGELIACMRFLHFVDLPTYRQGLAYLLDSQHRDGSWGDLERAHSAFGEYDSYGMILHSTLTALGALTAAFHGEWNADLFAAPTPTVANAVP